ncbi:MAG TPA: GNAT family N-acetyltransferase [Terracidiphilus sp.]
MKLAFAAATNSDAAELAALHSAAAEDLTRRFGQGFWSSPPTERGILANMRKPKFSRIIVAHSRRRIVGTLRLATKKPWAIDTAYFTPAARPLYLTGMAVHPDLQSEGVGRLLLKEAEAVARAWPADAIRLDAFDAAAGAGAFYAKCGYRQVASVVYKKDPLLYFELILSPGAPVPPLRPGSRTESGPISNQTLPSSRNLTDNQ